MPTGPPADDSFWRRPETPPADPEPTATPPDPARAPYAGPPPTVAPPPGWRPPLVVQPPPPRALPGQDMAAIDEAERSARTVTYGIGMVAGAITLVLVCLLCSRLLF